eukprot:615577-Heterocapsa_arctica.AAC.2
MEKEFQTKLRKTHYRIGEASNPGPGISKGKQSKIGEFFHHKHIEKDDKDMWCKEKGLYIENIAGDGNCVYTCLGKSRKIEGDRVRQIIHDNADTLWVTHMQHDEPPNELADLKNRTLDKKIWGQFEQVVMWSRIYQIKIEIHYYSMSMQTIDGDEYNLNKKNASGFYIATKTNGETLRITMI